MGTRFELILLDRPETHLRAVADEIIAEIHRLHGRFSRFESTSIVSQINRDGTGRAVCVDQGAFDLFALAESVRVASRGAFDVCVGHFMHSEHVSPSSRGSADAGPLTLNAAARRVALSSPAQIDLGALAKGFALDVALAILIEHDIPAALIHAGTSSVLARGVPSGATVPGWPIAVRSSYEPLPLVLRDEMLSVSAPRGRSLSTDPERPVSHIIDPRTGQPAAAVDTAATIFPITHPRAGALADAWSTAAIVLADELQDCLSHNPPARGTFHIHRHSRGWRTLAPHAAPELSPLVPQHA